MKDLIIIILLILLLLGIFKNEWTYRNTYRVSESSIRIDWLGGDWKGIRSIVYFFTEGDNASISFKDINKLQYFSVHYLDEKGNLNEPIKLK